MDAAAEPGQKKVTPEGSFRDRLRFVCQGDLPSQLLHELRVVGREELHHETKDGVFRPWRKEKTGHGQEGREWKKGR